MKKTRLIFSLTLITLMVLMVGCKEDETPPGPGPNGGDDGVTEVTFSVGETEVVVGETDFVKEFTLTLAEAASVDVTFNIEVICADDLTGSHRKECFELVNETITIAQGKTVGTGTIKFLKSVYTQEQVSGKIYVYAKITNSEFRVTPGSIQLNVKGSGSLSDDRYQMPIVYHVIYNSTSDVNYPPVGFFEEYTEAVNTLTNDKYEVGVEYVLIANDKNGNLLSERGVNRVKINTPGFENNDYSAKAQFVAMCKGEQYPLDECINVFIYDFRKYKMQYDNPNVLAYAYLPYASSKHPLGGLQEGDSYYKDLDFNHLHHVGMPFSTIFHATEDIISAAHEYGHYLGLFHPFQTPAQPNDHCDDTGYYDRDKYEDDLYGDRLADEYQRYDPNTSSWFTSDNIMDYFITHNNTFTKNQMERMHHVIKYGIGIPTLYQDPADFPTTRSDAPRLPGVYMP